MTMLRWELEVCVAEDENGDQKDRWGKESYGKASVAEGLLGYTNRKVEGMGS
jgi:hypothetical protein